MPQQRLRSMYRSQPQNTQRCSPSRRRSEADYFVDQFLVSEADAYDSYFEQIVPMHDNLNPFQCASNSNLPLRFDNFEHDDGSYDRGTDDFYEPFIDDLGDQYQQTHDKFESFMEIFNVPLDDDAGHQIRSQPMQKKTERATKNYCPPSTGDYDRNYQHQLQQMNEQYGYDMESCFDQIQPIEDDKDDILEAFVSNPAFQILFPLLVQQYDFNESMAAELNANKNPPLQRQRRRFVNVPGADQPIVQSKRSFPCHLCPMILPTSHTWSRHLKIHDSPASVQCPDCKFVLCHKPALNYHRNMACGVKRNVQNL